MIILTYHKVINTAGFEEQIRFLTTNYNVITLKEFEQSYNNARLDAKAVLITFDDGDFSVLENALPILLKYNCPAVLFVVTELIGTSQSFWWDEIAYLSDDPKLIGKAKTMTNQARMELLASLRNNKRAPEYRQLTWNELSKLEHSNVAICNHSHTHPMFDKLTLAELKNELELSRALMVEHGFKDGDVFAFPNGNWSLSSEEALSSLNFRFAFLFDHKLTRAGTSRYKISRLSVNDHTPLWKFRLILSGIHSLALPVIKKLHRILS